MSQGAPELKTLILLPVAEPAVAAGPGVDLSHVDAPDAHGLREKLLPLLHEPIGQATLDRIRQAILDHYTAAGHPFVDAGFPRQDVTEGALNVVVTEYRIGSVKVQGNKWFADRLILNGADLKPGATIDKTAMDERIATLNANPFLKVTPEFQTGAAAGTTDVTLATEDRFPVDVSAGFANNGNPTTGWERWNLGVSWGDALHLGHTLTYQLSTSSDFWHGLAHNNFHPEEAAFVGHTVSWSAPLPWGDTLQVSAAHQRQIPQLGPSLRSVGITDTLGLQYQMPIGQIQQLGFGVDYKRSNNALSFGGEAVQSGFTDVDEVSIHYNVRLEIPYAQLLIDNAVYVSPGGMTSGSRDGAYQPSGTDHSGTVGAKARFAYDKLTVTGIVPLPRELGLTLKASGQRASGTLLPSEQFSIAGVDTVRGYQEFGLAGTNGVLLSAELVGPAFHVGLPDDNLQPHIFFDHGQAWNPDPTDSTPAYVHSASAGIGGLYQVGRYFTLRMEQGWQLIRSTRQSANGAFMHLSATATW
jgi:hemolysin activation/secretion protein